MSLLYEDRTEILRRCFFDVQNEVGLGRNEEDYHPACKLWFAEHELPVVSKPPLRLMLDGEEAHVVVPDFVAWDAITIELKAVSRGLASSELVQLFDYLKFRGDRLGLIVNLGLDRVHVERIVYDPPSARLIEDWSSWKGALDGRERELGLNIRDALSAVYDAHGTGYGLEVVERLQHESRTVVHASARHSVGSSCQLRTLGGKYHGVAAARYGRQLSSMKTHGWQRGPTDKCSENPRNNAARSTDSNS